MSTRCTVGCQDSKVEDRKDNVPGYGCRDHPRGEAGGIETSPKTSVTAALGPRGWGHQGHALRSGKDVPDPSRVYPPSGDGTFSSHVSGAVPSESGIEGGVLVPDLVHGGHNESSSGPTGLTGGSGVRVEVFVLRSVRDRSLRVETVPRHMDL